MHRMPIRGREDAWMCVPVCSMGSTIPPIKIGYVCMCVPKDSTDIGPIKHVWMSVRRVRMDRILQIPVLMYVLKDHLLMSS